MKILLDRDKCQGHGRCYVLGPDVFGADDDGYGTLVAESLPAEFEEQAWKGVNNCPEDAIAIVEEDA